MIGSDLVRHLKTKFLITPITKKNYHLHSGRYFDIVINANGNSKRFWANQNPSEDFVKSTLSVYKSIFDFPCSFYIYISSSDVYENHTDPRFTKEEQEINPENLQPYGFNKYLNELIIEKYAKKFLILRSSMVLGKKLKKGPIYDIINNVPLFIKLKTRLQLITTRAVAEIIEIVLDKGLTNETINIGGVGTFTFTKIRRYFDRDLHILPKAEVQIYEMNVNKIKNLYPFLKTSEEYLQEFLNLMR